MTARSTSLNPLLSAGLLTGLLTWQCNLHGAQPPDEAWLEDDSELDSLAVNEGELHFLPAAGHADVLRSSTTLYITPDSLETGRVRLEQCYDHLDAVPRTEVVYAYDQMEGLKVTTLKNIESASVEGQRVRLEQVGQSARLCIEARVRPLHRTAPDFIALSNGPYHRRFLDGYYPYHVTLTIHYPADRMTPISVEPPPQAHFEVQMQPSPLRIDTRFEGRLTIKLLFREIRP